MSMQTNAPAGWYPTQPGMQQYWDGTKWTEHTAPLAAPAAPAAANNAVIVNQRKMYKTSHGFHLIMSICTLGLWLPIWLIVGIYNAAKA